MASKGIYEFQSPTYYDGDIQALALGLRYAADAPTATSFRNALDYFWADIAANTFLPRGSLGGPHSRSYDLFGGQGILGVPMYLAAFEPHPLERACPK